MKTRLFRIGWSNFDKLEDVIGEIDIYNGIRKTFPKSLTDESYYVPNSEVNKTIDKLRANSNIQGSYDFPTGSEEFDASTLAKLRRPGLDVAEVTEMTRKLDKDARDAVNNDIAEAQYQEFKKNKENAELQSKADSALKETIVNTVNQLKN